MVEQSQICEPRRHRAAPRGCSTSSTGQDHTSDIEPADSTAGAVEDEMAAGQFAGYFKLIEARHAPERSEFAGPSKVANGFLAGVTISRGASA